MWVAQWRVTENTEMSSGPEESLHPTDIPVTSCPSVLILTQILKTKKNPVQPYITVFSLQQSLVGDARRTRPSADVSESSSSLQEHTRRGPGVGSRSSVIVGAVEWRSSAVGVWGLHYCSRSGLWEPQRSGRSCCCRHHCPRPRAPPVESPPPWGGPGPVLWVPYRPPAEPSGEPGMKEDQSPVRSNS